jgi:hypothetical protein
VRARVEVRIRVRIREFHLIFFHNLRGIYEGKILWFWNIKLLL